MAAKPSLLPIDVDDDIQLYNHIIENPFTSRSVLTKERSEEQEEDADIYEDTSRPNLTDLLAPNSNFSIEIKQEGNEIIEDVPHGRCLDETARRFVIHLHLYALLKWRYLFWYILPVLAAYLALVHVTLMAAAWAVQKAVQDEELTIDRAGDVFAYRQRLYSNSTSSALLSVVRSYVDVLDTSSDAGVGWRYLEDLSKKTALHPDSVRLGARFDLENNENLQAIKVETFFDPKDRLGKLLSVNIALEAVKEHFRRSLDVSNNLTSDLTFKVSRIPLSYCRQVAFFGESYDLLMTVASAMLGLAFILLHTIFTFDKIDSQRSNFFTMMAQVQIRGGSVLPFLTCVSLDYYIYLVALILALIFKMESIALPHTLVLLSCGLPCVLLGHLSHRLFQRKLTFFLVTFLLQGPLTVVAFILMRTYDVSLFLDVFLKTVSPFYVTMTTIRDRLLTSEWLQFCSLTYIPDCSLEIIHKNCSIACLKSMPGCIRTVFDNEVFMLGLHFAHSLIIILMCISLNVLPVAKYMLCCKTVPKPNICIGSAEDDHYVNEGLTVVGLSHSFNVYAERSRLKDVNFHLGSGECLAVLGKRDSGNAVLARLVAGIIPGPETGSIRLYDPLWTTRDQHYLPVCYCGSECWLHPNLTGKENLLFAARLRYTGRKSIAMRKVTSIMADFALNEEDDDLVCYLSESVKKRFLLACACLAKPRVLVLDHPTEGLNWLHKIAVWNKLNHMQTEGHILLLSSNSGEECSLVGTSYMVLSDGKPMLQSTKDRIGTLVSGVYVYVWKTIDVTGSERSLVGFIKEAQRSFRHGVYAVVDDGRETYAIFPFVHIVHELDLAKIYELMESCQDRFLCRRYSVQATSLKNVLEAFQEKWQQY